MNDPFPHNCATLDATAVSLVVRLCMKATFFTFHDRLYQHTAGFPISFPISQLSDGGMSTTYLFSSIKPRFHPHTKKQGNSIVFTNKEEDNAHQLPFFDTLISRTPEGCVILNAIENLLLPIDTQGLSHTTC